MRTTVRHQFASPVPLSCLTALASVFVAAALAGCGSKADSKLDPALSRFVAAKRAQAMEFAKGETNPVPGEVWRFFDAVEQGRWRAATNHFEHLRLTSRLDRYSQPPPKGFFSSAWRQLEEVTGRLDRRSNPTALDGPLWTPIHETQGALEQFRDWDPGLLHRYGRDISAGIPTNSIYFGGTDPGRFVITALCESHADGVPFFVLTQNALADGTYLDYLRRIYGTKLNVPTPQDSQDAFTAYLKDAEHRLRSAELKPGESLSAAGDHIQVSGQSAVMEINGLLVRRIFDRNPGHDFFVEESFPLDWMYPYLTPHGLILKLNREPLPELSETTLREDHEYWQKYVSELTGGWLSNDSSLQDISDFVKKAYRPKTQAGFRDRVNTLAGAYMNDAAAQKAFSKLRSAIGGLYAWRAEHARTVEEKARLLKEADFTFHQAFALCPYSPEAVFRYVNLLLKEGRLPEARLVTETALTFDPTNSQFSNLLQQLNAHAAK
jgi:hypothetical protein